ncbi:hypothetical protein JW968_02195 [Candidatus Woesearchaeota archaeon]|nr:hypothetical protein [Candidatus Woesearchaeota archaeon]
MKNLAKYVIGLLTVLLLRLMPHPPNVEPIMATMMPFAKRWGWMSGLVFTSLAMLLFDLITRTIGVWSILTIGTYCLISSCAGIYLKQRENKIRYYVGFAIIGTIIYDAITGIGTGMIFFNQSFMDTLIGQIHFTLYHLAGNVLLSATLSPLLYKWALDNPNLETEAIMAKIGALA